MTELEFYLAAKKHFSKIRNYIFKIKPYKNAKALCSFLHEMDSKYNISNEVYYNIKSEISNAICSYNNTIFDIELAKYNTAYFPSHRIRLKFINSQIKKYSNQKV